MVVFQQNCERNRTLYLYFEASNNSFRDGDFWEWIGGRLIFLHLSIAFYKQFTLFLCVSKLTVTGLKKMFVKTQHNCGFWIFFWFLKANKFVRVGSSLFIHCCDAIAYPKFDTLICLAVSKLYGY